MHFNWDRSLYSLIAVLLSLGTLSVKAQMLSLENLYNGGMTRYHATNGIGQDLAELIDSEGQNEFAWYPSLSALDMLDCWQESLDSYDLEQVEALLMGEASLNLSELQYDMSSFRCFYRGGRVVEESEVLAVAQSNYLTASEINAALAQWSTSDAVLDEHADIEILEVSSEVVYDPELVTVGGLENVPEPSSLFLLLISGSLILKRRR